MGAQSSPDRVESVFTGETRVLLLGGAAGAAQLLDIIARSNELCAVGTLDDDPSLLSNKIYGVETLGGLSETKRLWDDGAFDALCIAIGTNIEVRARLFDTYASMGIPFANVIDPSVVISTDVKMGTGNFISAGSRIGPSTIIGNNCSISSFVSIEHHNVVGDHCTFGPDVKFSGFVEVGDRVKFGTGIAVEPRVKIGSDSIIASGVVLFVSVPSNSIVKSRQNYVARPR